MSRCVDESLPFVALEDNALKMLQIDLFRVMVNTHEVLTVQLDGWWSFGLRIVLQIWGEITCSGMFRARQTAVTSTHELDSYGEGSLELLAKAFWEGCTTRAFLMWKGLGEAR